VACRAFVGAWVKTSLILVLLATPPAWSQVATASHKRHVDRLEILAREHQDLTRLMQEAVNREPQDSGEIRAIKASLDALDKEIAYVQKQPVHDDSWSSSKSKTAKPAQAKPKPNTQALNYEAWDIFRNFGTEGATNESKDTDD